MHQLRTTIDRFVFNLIFLKYLSGWLYLFMIQMVMSYYFFFFLKDKELSKGSLKSSNTSSVCSFLVLPVYIRQKWSTRCNLAADEAHCRLTEGLGISLCGLQKLHVNLGFEARHVLTVQAALTKAKMNQTSAGCQATIIRQ